MAKIFISYRREDTAAAAGRLYDRLVPHFGKDQLFMDVDTIEPGERFSDVVQRTVGSCDILLALIGDRWLSIKDASGETRLSNPDDWVRLEVGTALKRDIRVIPVLINGATVPRRGDLPEDLTDLAMRHAIDVTHAHFHSDVDRLLQTLDKVLGRQANPGNSLRQDKPDARSSSSTGARLVEKSSEPKQASDKRLWAAKIGILILNLPLAVLEYRALPWLGNSSNLWFVMTRLGISFGLVLALWSAHEWSELRWSRLALFVACSVASANLALYLGLSLGEKYSLWGVVIIGALLLAVSYRLVLGSSWWQFLGANVLAVALFYLLPRTLKMVMADGFENCAPLYWQLGFFLGIHWFGKLKLFEKRA